MLKSKIIKKEYIPVSKIEEMIEYFNEQIMTSV